MKGNTGEGASLRGKELIWFGKPWIWGVYGLSVWRHGTGSPGWRSSLDLYGYCGWGYGRRWGHSGSQMKTKALGQNPKEHHHWGPATKTYKSWKCSRKCFKKKKVVKEVQSFSDTQTELKWVFRNEGGFRDFHERDVLPRCRGVGKNTSNVWQPNILNINIGTKNKRSFRENKLWLEKNWEGALAGVAQWIEHQPGEKVTSSIPRLGHMPGLWARSLVGGAREAHTHWGFSPSLPLSLKINK